MRYLLAGASGFLGRNLAAELRSNGHEVVRLVRGAPTETTPDAAAPIAGQTSARGGRMSRNPEIVWDPSSGHLDPSALIGFDGVVGLSGAGIGDKRWTDTYKRTLVDSRVQPTRALAAAFAALPAADRPAVFLSASAVGIYGDRGDELLPESAPPGTGFLADLVVQWEAAARAASEVGVRVAFLRTGLVLARSGGLLKRLLPLYKLGAGGNLGSGQQYQPWITLADEVAAIRHVLQTPTVVGAVNLSAPAPVRNSEFGRALATAVHRPAVITAPAFALRIALGEFADEGVLASQRAIPQVLNESGFSFQHPSLAGGLAWALQH